MPVTGWDFTWLDGRAIEERPSWRYFDSVVERTRATSTMLDLETGSGSMIESLPALPEVVVATEGYAPNVALAARRLRARGAHLVVASDDRPELPIASDAFELVTSRHPIITWWEEIARVLRPRGTYFAQHVGPHSLRGLSEFLMGPLPQSSNRDPEVARRAAVKAGLVVEDLQVERPRTVFYDIGAVVYFLRLVVWIVPGFTVDKYRSRLLALHNLIQRDGPFETTASRYLIEATKPF